MDILKLLSPEERVEYDELLRAAGYDGDQHRPSSEIGERMHALLLDAGQGGRTWATYVIDDDARSGHLSRFKRWDKQQSRMRVFHRGAIVPRAAVMGVIRTDEETGVRYHQGAFWREMSWDDVRHILTSTRTRIESERITEGIATRLLMLHMEEPDSIGPADACEQAGYDFDEFMAGEAVA